MKYLIPIIFLIIVLTYLIYFTILKYKFKRGIKYKGVIKDYKKYKRYRVYNVKVSNKETIYISTPKFYMLNSNLIVSKFKNKYYNEININDIFIKLIIFSIITLLIFMYVAIK